MNRSAVETGACTALGLLELLPMLRGGCSEGSGGLLDVGKRHLLPPLCQTCLLEFGTWRLIRQRWWQPMDWVSRGYSSYSMFCQMEL